MASITKVFVCNENIVNEKYFIISNSLQFKYITEELFRRAKRTEILKLIFYLIIRTILV